MAPGDVLALKEDLLVVIPELEFLGTIYIIHVPTW